MKLEFLEIETIMLNWVFFISWDQEQKSENKVLENSDDLIFLMSSKTGNTEITIKLKNLVRKMHSQIKEAQIIFKKESKALDAASDYQFKNYW